MSRFDLPDLSTRDLLTVVAVAEHRSFVKAAKLLKVTQPSLTRTVKKVERAFGVLLFDRNTRRVYITPAGREFVVMAQRMLNELKAVPVRGRRMVNGPIGRVTVSTYPTFASQMMPSLVHGFLAARPSLEVHIRECHENGILEDVRSGVADFGIGVIAGVGDPFGRQPLFQENLWVAVPRGHRLCKPGRRSVRLSELRGELLVSMPNDSLARRTAEAAAAAIGLGIRYAVVADCVFSAVAHVKAGVGPAIVPSAALSLPPWEGLEAYPLAKPSLRLAVGIITLKGRRVAPAATTFAAWLLERCRAPAPILEPQIPEQPSQAAPGTSLSPAAHQNSNCPPMLT
jgi:DNA-binding transcriptional LysR family regulator